MAQAAALLRDRLTKSTVSYRARFESLPPLLFFPIEARVLHTRFRAHALRTIYGVAREELGLSLESALVSTWSQPGEAGSTILLLSITAKVDREKLRQVHKAILAKVAEEASFWSDEQKKDYSEKIYFELTQVDV